MMPDLIPLPLVIRELRALTGQLPRGGYRSLYAKVLSMQVPAEQIGGRWHIRREDLPAVAERLGLVPAHDA